MPPPKALPPFIESWPGLGFVAVLLLTGDLRLAGWTGALLALLVFGWLAWRRCAPDTIALGINLFTLACAPLVEALHLAGLGMFGNLLLDHLQTALLLVVALTGASLTLLTPSGFVGQAGPESLRGSLALVVLALIATLLRALQPFPALPLNAGGVLIGLFLARGWLRGRIAARSGDTPAA